MARTLHQLGQLRLQADEKVNLRRGDQCEEVDGALDLQYDLISKQKR